MLNFVFLLEFNRAALRQLQNHVVAAVAWLRMKFNASSVKRRVTLPHMFSAMLVLFVKRAVRFGAGSHILPTMLNKS